MNAAHLHLVTNHFPVVGLVIGLATWIVAMGWRSPDLRRFGLGLFVLIGVLGAVAFFSGEPAEEVVERLPGVTESLIERHEDAALVAFVLLEAIAALSLAALLMPAAPPLRGRGFDRVLLVLAVAAAGAMGWVANLGGEIRHSEIRKDSIERPAEAEPPGT